MIFITRREHLSNVVVLAVTIALTLFVVFAPDRVYATAIYQPGETLDPSCVPTDPDCRVVSPSVLGNNTFSTTSSDHWFTTKNTDILQEGSTNKYFSSALARNVLTVSATGLSYNNSTGVISLTSGYNIPLSASTTEWSNKADYGAVVPGALISFDGARLVSTSSPTMMGLIVNGLGYFQDLVVSDGITLGGVFRTTWPSGGGGSGGSWWATSTSGLIGYPDLAGNYAVVIGAAATSSNVRFEVNGNSKFDGGVVITGSVSSSNFSGSSSGVNTGDITLGVSANGLSLSGQILSLATSTLKTALSLVKSDVGLGNVANVDTTNPINITQSASYRFVTDAEKGTWNGKQNALTTGTTGQYFRGDLSLGSFSSDVRAAISNNVVGLNYNSSTGVWSSDPSYNIPLNASTTAWNNLAANFSIGVGGVLTITPADNATSTFSGALSVLGNTNLGTTTMSRLVVVSNSTSTSNTIPPILLTTDTGSELLRINSDDVTNLFMGYRAGMNNIASSSALKGVHNYFLGSNAGMSNVSGSSNVAIGTNALYSSVTGGSNVALGNQALYSNLGNDNVGIGENSLSLNTTGEHNTAIGIAALRLNVTGRWNTAIGESSLYNNLSDGNATVGFEALRFNSGAGNTAIGAEAGTGDFSYTVPNEQSKTDNYMTFIGFQATRDGNVSSTTPLANGTAIGYKAKVGCSNCLVLGGTGAYYAKVGIGSTTPTAMLVVQGTSTNALLNITASTTASVLYIDSIGNVGVGTTSPAALFSVGGSIYVGGNITATGSLSISGNTILGNASTSNLTIGSLSGILFGTAGSVGAVSTSSLKINTADLVEGNNLFWTNARFDARLSTNTSLPNLAALTGLSIIGSSTGTTTMAGGLAVSGNSFLATTTISSLILNQPLSLTYGGTGATTSAGVLANLGIAFASNAEAMVQSYTISAWGDSLTSAYYPGDLAQLLGHSTVNNMGIGGQTSTQIKDRMIADTAKHGDITVIWVGQNNLTPSVVEADIATMVAALDEPKRFLVMPPPGSSSCTTGTSCNNNLIQITSDLAALYPNNFFDIRGYLIDQYDPSLAQDVTDHANNVTPSSLRADATHLTAAGYWLVARQVAAFIRAHFDPAAAHVLVQSNLPEMFASPHAIGIVNPDIGKFTNLTIASASTTVSTTTPLLLLTKSDGTTVTSLTSDDTSNLFLGQYTGINNSITGIASQGKNNIFIGGGAGRYNTIGGVNLAIGQLAMNSNILGSSNLAIGLQALYTSTSSNGNIAIGGNSMYSNTTGEHNTSVGSAALFSNTTGLFNTAIGEYSLYSNLSTWYNTAVGADSLRSLNTNSGRNTAIGYRAGYGDGILKDQQSTIDSYMTFIGFQASRSESVASTSALSYGTAIGFNAKVACSNCLVLGGTGADSVKVGIGTSSPAVALHVLSATAPQFRLAYDSANYTNFGIGSDGALTITPTGVATTSIANGFTVNGTSLVVQKATGYVGIGPSSPAYKLDVAGDMNISAGSYYRYNGATMAYGSSTLHNWFFGEAGTIAVTATGTNNIGIGYQAMDALNNGGGAGTSRDNVGVGVNSMTSNTYGLQNSAFGGSSLYNNTTGSNNMAIGFSSLISNTTGSGNVGVGINTLYYLNDPAGSQNVAIGHRAAERSAAGASNDERSVKDFNSLFIGAYAHRDPVIASTSALSNATAIGYNAAVGCSNCLVLGGTGAGAVNVGIGTSTPAFKFQVYVDASNEGHVAATGDWARTSDVNLKKNISTMEGVLNKLMRLRGVTYDWKNDVDATSSKHIGFIAQEVEAVFPEFVDTGTNGIKGVSYGAFTPILLQAIKEQQGQIASMTGASTTDLAFATSSDLLDGVILPDEAALPPTVLGYLQSKIARGLSIARELIAERVTALVGYFGFVKADKVHSVNGYETVDKATGDTYCIYVENGGVKSVRGTCDNISASTPVIQQPTVSNSSVDGSPVEATTTSVIGVSTTTSVAEESVSPPPVIESTPSPAENTGSVTASEGN